MSKKVIQTAAIGVVGLALLLFSVTISKAAFIADLNTADQGTETVTATPTGTLTLEPTGTETASLTPEATRGHDPEETRESKDAKDHENDGWVKLTGTVDPTMVKHEGDDDHHGSGTPEPTHTSDGDHHSQSGTPEPTHTSDDGHHSGMPDTDAGSHNNATSGETNHHTGGSGEH